MSAVHWSLPGQVGAGAASFVMGAAGLASLVGAGYSAFVAIKIAQGRLEEKYVPANTTKERKELAEYLNKLRSKAVPSFAGAAIVDMILGGFLLRGAYLLSKAVYLKTSLPSLAFTIATGCLGLAIYARLPFVISSIMGKAQDQEKSAAHQRRA